MEFKAAPLDKPAALISVFTILFLVGMSIFFIIKVPLGWAFATFMMLIIIVCYLLSPKRYFFEGGKFYIEKVAGKRIAVPINEIEACITVPDFIQLRPLRLFGNGGLFGYYGLFSTSTYGQINCQLTRLKNLLILKSKKGNFAISPADPAQFKEYLASIASGISDTISEITPESKKIKPATPLIIIVPGAVLSLVIITTILFYPQLTERIATHFDFNGNPNGWGPRSIALTAGLIPSAVIFFLNVIVFFSIRKRLTEPWTAYFIVFIFSLAQLFAAYASFDIFYFNIQGTHWIAINYVFFGFLALFVIVILLYYRMLKKKAG